jgi:4-hydroxy-3-methylbut-2-enyl diphosphate reductase
VKIIVADKSGFCFGVKKAYKMCSGCFGGLFETLGPLIHNEEILAQISEEGGRIINDPSESSGGRVVVRAHGISQCRYAELKKRTSDILDATCPFVLALQESARGFYKEGYSLFIVGQGEHPEIRSITEDIPSRVIFSEEEACAVGFEDRIALISQTTEVEDKFERISEILRGKCNDFKSKNTICLDVRERQKSAVDLAKKCDVVLVVGGRSSSNTRKLHMLCSKYARSYHILDENEIKKDWLNNCEILGIVTGSSTSEDVIYRVRRRAEEMV